METISISFVNGRQSVLRFGGRIAGAVRAIIRRPAKIPGHTVTKASHEAWTKKEQCQATSMAQLQYGRYFNR